MKILLKSDENEHFTTVAWMARLVPKRIKTRFASLETHLILNLERVVTMVCGKKLAKGEKCGLYSEY